MLKQIMLQIPIPASTLFVPSSMDPNQFATLLAEHGQEFAYRDLATFEIPIPGGTAVEQLLLQALNTITNSTNLQVVEVVPGAASLYAKSAQGVQVAGLLKYDLSVPEQATITIDLKCTDDGFLEALVDQVQSIDQNSFHSSPLL